MDKKVKKNLSAALATTVVAGIGATAIPAQAAEVKVEATKEQDVDKLYAEAHAATMKVVETAKANEVKAYFDIENGGASTTEAVVKAVEVGMQKEINAARAAIAALPENMETAIGRFSEIVDDYQHPVYERIVTVINKLIADDAKITQAEINAARTLIVEAPDFIDDNGNQARPTYSGKLDEAQIKFENMVRDAIDKAEKSKTEEDLAAAKALVDELATVTNNDGVKAKIAGLREELAEIEEAAKKLEVSSVEATGVKNLKVTFSKAVEDTSKAIFKVKRGNTVVSTTATWNEDKTEATLASSVKLIAGDYEITVTGLNTEEGKNIATTTVVPERIETIELNDNAFRDKATNTTLTVEYKLFNQYKENVTEDHAITNFIVTSNEGKIANSQPKAKGTIEITDVKDDVKTLSVTVVDKVFAKTAAKTINVQAAKTLEKVTLGQPEIPEKKEKIESTATDVVIPYEAVDQFGEEVALSNIDGLTFISSDATALPVANVKVETISGKDKLVIDSFGNFNGSKEITLTVIVNATGQTSKVKFTVYGTAVADTPTLVAPTENTGIGQDTNIELNMLDIYGNEMKAEEIAKLTEGDVTIISSNTSIFTAATKPILVDKKAVVVVNGVQKGTANLMITVNSTGKTYTIPVTVVDAKYPASISLALDTDAAAKDGEITLKATFKDQYGNEMKESDNIVKLTADNDDFTVSGEGLKTTPVEKTVTDLAKDGIVIKATDWEKVTKIKAELVDNKTFVVEKVVDTKTITVESTKEDAKYTYSVEAISTLYGEKANTKDSDYAQAIKVVAKDASGKTVALPAEYVTNITSTNKDIIADASEMKVWAVNKGTATLAFWKGTDKLAEVEVTASDVAPEVKTISFKKESITIDAKNKADALLAIKGQLEIKNQYGVVIDPVGGVNGMWTSNKASVITFDENQMTAYENGEAIIGFITSNGKIATIKVVITNKL